MSVNVTISGVTYAYPTEGEEGWASVASQWAVAVSSQLLQRSGGTFTLTAEVDFGATFATKQAYIKSRTANPATAGFARLARADVVSWRNQANGANLDLGVDASNRLTFNGNIIIPSTGVVQPTEGGTGISSYATGDTLYASASNVLSKLSIGAANRVYTSDGSIPAWALLVNANIDAAAAIAYSKLNLSGSIVNADVNASAAIAYSKLNLSGSIVNADVNASAAIAYSKLNLSDSILNADINSAAAIARSKIAAGTADHVVINAASTGVLSSEAQLAVARGGTNIASYTTGDIIYASGATTLAKLAATSNGFVMKLASGLPSWSVNTSSFGTSTKVFADSPVTISNTLDAYAFDTSGGAIAATLPDCATNPGKVFFFKKTTSDFNAVTISRAGSDTIIDAGAAVNSTTLNTIGEEIMLVSFGSTVWQVFNRRIPSIWVAWTPTGAWSTNTTYTGFWKRVGASIVLQVGISLGGAPTSANLKVNFISGLTVDSAKLTTGGLQTWCGSGNFRDDGSSANFPLDLLFSDSYTTMSVFWSNASSTALFLQLVTQAVPVTAAIDDGIVFTTSQIPVTGWNG